MRSMPICIVKSERRKYIRNENPNDKSVSTAFARTFEHLDLVLVRKLGFIVIAISSCLVYFEDYKSGFNRVVGINLNKTTLSDIILPG